MKVILQNIEKIITFILLILFIIVVTVARIGLIKKVEPVTFPQVPEEFNVPEKDRIQFEMYDELIAKVTTPRPLSDYVSLSKKDFFSAYKQTKPSQPLFIIREINSIPLNIVYQGVIELPGDRLVTQINFDDKTYFLKEGGRFGEYEVKEITKDFCVISDAEAREIRLPYKKKIFSEEYEALIYDTNTKNLLKVKKGFKIREYEILDIDSTYVVLLDKDKKQLVLKRGEE